MDYFKHIIPYKLFEILEPVKPNTCITTRKNIHGYITTEIEFDSSNIMYTATMINCYDKTNEEDFYYITFTTKERHDKIMQAFRSGQVMSDDEFELLNKEYSKLTNSNLPYSVFSSLMWIVPYVKNKYNDTINNIGFSVMSDNDDKISKKRENIYMHIITHNGGHVIGQISHPISTENISLYSLND